jgi:hypothetical protein
MGLIRAVSENIIMQAVIIESSLHAASFETHEQRFEGNEGETREYVLEERIVTMHTEGNGSMSREEEDAEEGGTLDRAEGEEGEASESEVVVSESVVEEEEEVEADEATEEEDTDQQASQPNEETAGEDDEEDEEEEEDDEEHRTLKQKWWDYLVT